MTLEQLGRQLALVLEQQLALVLGQQLALVLVRQLGQLGQLLALLELVVAWLMHLILVEPYLFYLLFCGPYDDAYVLSSCRLSSHVDLEEMDVVDDTIETDDDVDFHRGPAGHFVQTPKGEHHSKETKTTVETIEDEDDVGDVKKIGRDLVEHYKVEFEREFNEILHPGHLHKHLTPEQQSNEKNTHPTTEEDEDKELDESFEAPVSLKGGPHHGSGDWTTPLGGRVKGDE